MIITQPAQETRGFRAINVVGDGRGLRQPRQFFRQFQRLSAHRIVISHRSPHVAQHPLQFAHQILLRIDLKCVDFGVHHGDRLPCLAQGDVVQVAQPQFAPRQLHEHRVGDEGHVRMQDLHNAAAMVRHRRFDLDDRGCRVEGGQVTPGIEGELRIILGGSTHQIFGDHTVPEVAHKLREVRLGLDAALQASSEFRCVFRGLHVSGVPCAQAA